MSLVVNCQVSTYINIKTEPSCSTLQETSLQTKAKHIYNSHVQSAAVRSILRSVVQSDISPLSISDYPALHAAPTSAEAPCRQSNILQNTWKGRGGDETSALTNITSALI